MGVSPWGELSFLTSASNTTGNALADMYQARIAQYMEGTAVVNGVPVGGNARGYWRGTDTEFYVGDDWKMPELVSL